MDLKNYDDVYEPGEVRLLRLLSGEEILATHVGFGTEDPNNTSIRSVVYKDPRQLVYQQDKIAMVPLMNFYHEKYGETHRTCMNLVVSYMKVNELLARDYRTSVSKIATPTQEQVEAVGRLKLIT